MRRISQVLTTISVTLFVLSCAPIRPAHLPDEERKAIDLFVRSWEAAIGHIPQSCFVREARITRAKTENEFIRLCGAYPADVSGCMVQVTQQVKLVVYALPHVVIRPREPIFDTTGGIVVHELAHWAIGCIFNRRGPDVQDGKHSEQQVWTAASLDAGVRSRSVQGRARAELYPEIFGSPLLSFLYHLFVL